MMDFGAQGMIWMSFPFWPWQAINWNTLSDWPVWFAPFVPSTRFAQTQSSGNRRADKHYHTRRTLNEQHDSKHRRFLSLAFPCYQLFFPNSRSSPSRLFLSRFVYHLNTIEEQKVLLNHIIIIIIMYLRFRVRTWKPCIRKLHRKSSTKPFLNDRGA